ncbi:MAG: bifunctional riboflavin kinase/FAD synthetase [Yaniella sp.]|uniref:bifunctional riboflavin kinase/FAD synthetase n=1 Tax=Yaniella sp. TaxID=2773929 RepID=UPI0017CA26EE|nr:bifunctional riboflavin kinase/FAD synthetase [Yaniella sp.]NLZ98393.1 bifunctional riboflavin kinase/FAD synthetase [Micrococcus sp.]MDN5704476.1 bifunctional riboflavin kinase/FAD synthetase [Yaniella sp.]MDN5730366.1 bifunctional riboflavin kinase/FAD synthetase [Yaniella sp.]MDN5814361.1 bifunctional riboflavin kinase/FAD synthetase [Yaniella sp.]MDN5816756.1 bifunctional riboflavin kinase/FAD synthetase [Yaniella sp.]
MQYWAGTAAIGHPSPSVVTLGNFDGVHRGHRAVLKLVDDTAKQHDLQSVAVTFDPHPRLVHLPEEPLVPIVSLPQKIRLLESCNLDATLVIHYTLDFATQTAQEFVENILVEALNARIVVVGSDTRFGAGNTGDINTLRKLGKAHNFDVVQVDDVGETERWSSTWVRDTLEAGKVAQASRILGRYHTVEGEIVHGHARGRELGFPTANFASDSQGMIPADGVYAGWFTDERGNQLPAAISVGSNPTFNDIVRTVEAHIFDRPDGEVLEDFNLYGQHCAVEFVARLRGMKAFTGIDDLIEQMDADVGQAGEILSGKAPEIDAPQPRR